MKLDDQHTLTDNAHPDTSHSSAAATLLRSGTARRRVLEALVFRGPRTDDELQEALSMPANTERPRRVELLNMGYVEDSKLRRLTETRSPAIVWQATKAGYEALRS